MANMKIVAMVEAAAKETRAQNLADIQAAIILVDQEIDRIDGLLEGLRLRIIALEEE
jgi:hypothetical protein